MIRAQGSETFDEFLNKVLSVGDDLGHSILKPEVSKENKKPARKAQ